MSKVTPVYCIKLAFYIFYFVRVICTLLLYHKPMCVFETSSVSCSPCKFRNRALMRRVLLRLACLLFPPHCGSQNPNSSEWLGSKYAARPASPRQSLQGREPEGPAQAYTSGERLNGLSDAQEPLLKGLDPDPYMQIKAGSQEGQQGLGNVQH